MNLFFEPLKAFSEDCLASRASGFFHRMHKRPFVKVNPVGLHLNTCVIKKHEIAVKRMKVLCNSSGKHHNGIRSRCQISSNLDRIRIQVNLVA